MWLVWGVARFPSTPEGCHSCRGGAVSTPSGPLTIYSASLRRPTGRGTVGSGKPGAAGAGAPAGATRWRTFRWRCVRHTAPSRAQEGERGQAQGFDSSLCPESIGAPCHCKQKSGSTPGSVSLVGMAVSRTQVNCLVSNVVALVYPVAKLLCAF